MAEDFFTEDIGYEPQLAFTNDENEILPKVRLSLKNGGPVMIDELEAIRQWIIKFTMTEKGAYPIYDGTEFGNRIKSLFGRKSVGYGYEEAEVERDFREGLPLCPAISQVTKFELSKTGKILNVDLEVELYNGELLNVFVENVYIIGGFDCVIK